MKIITLPGLWDKYELNLAFLRYCQSHKEQLIDNKIYFVVTGSFPQDSWSGHRNYQSPFVLHRGIADVLNNYYQLDVICRFDCSSLFFDSQDYNVFGRIALELGNNGSNQIEISTFEAYKYLKEKYPLYTFVGSEFMIDFDNNYNLHCLVRNKHNPSLPTNNFPKNKIESIIDYPCENCPTEQWSTCIAQEQTNLINFTNKTVFNCKNYTCDIHKIPQTKGINIFRSQIANYNQNYTRQLEEYIRLIIKPEYQNEARLFITMDYREE